MLAQCDHCGAIINTTECAFCPKCGASLEFDKDFQYHKNYVQQRTKAQVAESHARKILEEEKIKVYKQDLLLKKALRKFLITISILAVVLFVIIGGLYFAGTQAQKRYDIASAQMRPTTVNFDEELKTPLINIKFTKFNFVEKVNRAEYDFRVDKYEYKYAYDFVIGFELTNNVKGYPQRIKYPTYSFGYYKDGIWSPRNISLYSYNQYQSDIDMADNDFINLITNATYYMEDHVYIRVEDFETRDADGIYIQFLDEIVVKIPMEKIKESINTKTQ